MNNLKFLNESQTEDLFSNGFCVFDLLNQKTVDQLRAIFQDYHSEQPEGFYATTHIEDKAKRKQISDHVQDIISAKIESHFENIQLLGGAFISKAPGQNGILPLHQDWNLVDESKARSYNLWIPLIDVNEENGAMRLLPKSHMKQRTFRGPNVAPVLFQISSEVDKHMFSLNMKSGQAVVYDHALWHSSPRNKTSQLRLAYVLGVVPTKVALKYYHQVGDLVEDYDSHSNFFFENDRESGPKGLNLSQTFKFPNTQLNQSEFEHIYLGQPTFKEIKKGFFQKLFKR